MHEHARLAIRTLILLLMVSIVTPAALSGLEKPAQNEEERFRASASNRTYVSPNWSKIDIVINRWTTPEEREALFEVLMAGDQSAFRQALTRQEMTGWIQFRNSPRNVQSSPGNAQSNIGQGRYKPPIEFRYAWVRSQSEDGSREIILATDDIIPFRHEWSRLESFDCRFSLIRI